MKRLQILALLTLSVILFNSCSNDNSTNPKNGCNYTIDKSLANLYDCPPSVDDCYEGKLVNAEKMKALDRLNFFRQLHGLPEVTYNPNMDEAVQKSALIAVANSTLTHFPPTSASCYSTQGDTACQKSNLHWGRQNSVWSSAASIDGWINEKNSASIGHRRWFLCPFLKSVSFGRVDKIADNGQYLIGTTMYVWDFNGPTDANVEFVACPFHDYPVSAFDTGLILSFSVLADKSGLWSNSNINYSSTTIKVLDDSQNSYTVNNIKFDNDGYGTPNNIEWKTAGLQYNVKYTVKINNVIVKGQTKNYEYWFKIVN